MLKNCFSAVAAVLGMLGAMAVPAGAWGQTVSQTPVMKKVIVEYRRNIAVFVYEKPITVARLEKGATRNQNPEQAAVALFSAMAASDYDWWLSQWSTESQQMMLDLYKQQGRKPADMVKNWAGLLTTRPVELLGRAEFVRNGDNFALIRYQIPSRSLTGLDVTTGKQIDLGKQNFFGTLVLKRSRDLRWEASQELSSDPLMADDSELWAPERLEIRITRAAN